ncbi:MAG: tRNA (adenosine(37)-N6)-threonylcarbamoyltransferase complex transferase subunit TsaD [Alphaproteobacteria bacterium]|nr:tRNA (adenosine(37)-N6)-threonylcarbamoyltransferase complex transferase subunit TsaD [Alphaproteobacteria bacterium]
MNKVFTVLGIESSCDETAVALVRSDKTVLSHALASQYDEHAAYGGVVPEIAARAHLAHIDALVVKACADANLSLHDIDAVAATTGPGLIGGVIVGAMVGKAIAAATGKPFIAINHLEAHALTARLSEEVEFPYGLLLVSGGHCQILLVKGVGDYEQLGATRDDALGEAFDKCAKMLGLPYPGGPALEQAALNGKPIISLPRPMLGTNGCDFSFSGLKTAVRLAIEAADNRDAVFIANMAASFQQTVASVLHDRLSNALAMMPHVKGLVVAGGVAANQYLRGQIAKTLAPHNVALHVPPMALCTDNAVMVAWAGVERYALGKFDRLDTEPKARWPLVTLKQQA